MLASRTTGIIGRAAAQENEASVTAITSGAIDAMMNQSTIRRCSPILGACHRRGQRRPSFRGLDKCAKYRRIDECSA